MTAARKSQNTKPFAMFLNYEGIDTTKSDFIIQPSSALTILNMHKGSTGSFSAYQQGYTQLTGSLETAQIDSLLQFTDVNKNKYLLPVTNGKVTQVNSVSGLRGTDVCTTLVPGNMVSATTLKGSLYFTDNATQPQKWNGTGTSSDMGSFPVTNGVEVYNFPKMMTNYANRLVSANFNGVSSSATPASFPSHLVISDLLAPDSVTLTPISTVTNGAVIQVAPGDGQDITALKTISLPNDNSSRLLIFKDFSVYLLSGDTPETFNIDLVNDSFGCLNPNCVIQVGSDLYFADENGINSLTTAVQSGTLQPKIQNEIKIRDTFQSINLNSKDKAWMTYHKTRNEVWFGIPTGSSTEVDTILVYALPNNDSETPLWSIRKGFPSPPRCAIQYGKVFFTGDGAGQVHKWFISSNYNGTPYQYQYLYPYFDFGSIAQNKDITVLNAWFMVVGTETITIKQQWRGGGNSNLKTTVKSVSPKTLQAIYGTVSPPAAIYGQSYYGNGVQLVMVQIPTLGNGLQCQLSIEGTSGTTAPIFLGFNGLVRYGRYSQDYR